MFARRNIFKVRVIFQIFLKSKLMEITKNSLPISNPKVIDKFTADSKNTFLVSFPRTGSHWLRMLMELYFQRPSLTLVFFLHENRYYLSLHTHDLSLDLIRENVIYLYRSPVDTIYSQLIYNEESFTRTESVIYWAQSYARHLQKWLIQDNFTLKKTVVSYEELRQNPETT